MYEGHHVAVVVPVYNERRFVAEVLEAVPAFVDTVYAVDDCSTDGTWVEIQRCAATAGQVQAVPVESGAGAVAETAVDAVGPEIVPIRHDRNRGRGAAVTTGYEAALADDADVVAVMDGDGQMDPAALDRLLDPIVTGDADYAKGNRLGSPSHRWEMSAWRVFGNTVLTGLTRIASGYWRMTDAQNGYTAISRDALARLDLDDLYDGYGFLNDVLIHLNVQNARIVDVPTPAHYGDEESGIRYRSFVPMLALLLAMGFSWRLQRKYWVTGYHPVGVLYGFALLTGAGGVGYALQSLVVDSGGLDARIVAAAMAVSLALACAAFAFERRSSRDLVFSVDRNLAENED